MKKCIYVIGGANLDISATLFAPFIANDSNPGHVTLGHGGVARNIAHNLSLLGHDVKFVSVFGSDIFGGLMMDHCRHIGLDITLSEHVNDYRTGTYLCINNQSGDMIAAVADTEIISHITPEFLERRLGELNKADYIVTDTNVSEAALSYLLSHCVAPVCVDSVSTTKAWRIINALNNSHTARLHALKLNLKEALVVTGMEDYREAARKIIDLGVENVYITLGSEGVYCAGMVISGEVEPTATFVDTLFPALPVEVKNTTGAGDAFLAGAVHAYCCDIPFPQTAQYGLMAARATLMSEQAVNPDIANILL